jgi:hypothetical protein
MSIVHPPRRWGRRPALDGYGGLVRLHKAHAIALAVRNGLLIALIVHAVTTVIFSPRRNP